LAYTKVNDNSVQYRIDKIKAAFSDMLYKQEIAAFLSL